MRRSCLIWHLAKSCRLAFFGARHGRVYLCRVLEAARLNHNVTLRRKRESMSMSKEFEVFISPTRPRVFWGMACGEYCGGHVSLRCCMIVDA